MKDFKRQLYILMAALWLAAGSSAASPLEDLKPIGTSTFKWMFWTVYDAALYNTNGEYNGIEPELALKLLYRRNITRERLIETTRDQWQELDLYQEEVHERWLSQLDTLWPDISRGDSITLVVEDDYSATFYHNEARIGGLDDEAFTKTFLAIWLGDEVNFPRFRDELLGIR